MNKYILVLLSLLFPIFIKAQTLGKPEFAAEAKLVTLTNDTISGTTIIDKKYRWNDFKGSDIGTNFFFKEAGQAESKRIRPKKVKGFQIKTSDSSWATFISSNTLDHFDSEEGTTEFMGKVFLLRIIEGAMNVYHYYYFNAKANFKDGISEPQLIKILYKKGASQIFHTEIYEAWQSKLLSFVKDCPALVAELKAVKCGWSFIQVAEYYNSKCK